jgi:hypothetical protein
MRPGRRAVRLHQLVIAAVVVAGLLFSSALLAVLTPATPAFADTFAVNDTADAGLANPAGTGCVSSTSSGSCTLRAAIQAAENVGGSSFIALEVPGTYHVTLGELTVNSVTISVANSSGGAVAIDGNDSSRVFHLGTTAAATVALAGLTVQHGRAPAGQLGGGMLVDGGSSLTLVDSTLSNNTTAVAGGGLTVNDGTAQVINSALTDNHAALGAALTVSSGKTVNLLNVTIANNVATGTAGALAAGGTANLTNVTVTGNTSGSPGAVHVGAGTITLKSSVIAGNVNGDCSTGGSPIVSNGDNLDDDGTCNLGPSDIPNTPAMLGTLGSYGGTTATVPLLPGSPAIDGVTHNACPPPATDQRDVTRPQGARCDIGAFEGFIPLTATPTPTATATATSTVTPTSTATPTPPPTSTSTATPTPFARPNVGLQLTPGAPKHLTVTLTARDAGCRPNNRIAQVEITSLTNAIIELPGNVVLRTAPVELPLSLGVPQVSFTLVRITDGESAMASLLVTDGCGGWPTFVGGGPTAF